MNLIIDIGNTAAKLALFAEQASEPERVIVTSNQTLELLEATVEEYADRLEGGIASTVIDLQPQIYDRLRALPFPLQWLTHETKLPFNNLYRSPKTLGTDRLAAVAGAYYEHPGRNILIIDAGTCITYDFIDSQGNYHGGNISPGMQMRLRAMHLQTGRLPLVKAQGERPALGVDTETAIRSGVWQGIAYEIQGYLQTLSKEHDDLLTFLTGGDVISFDASIKNSIFADENLVLKGLNRLLTSSQ